MCKNLNFGDISRLCPNTVTWPKYPKITAVTFYMGKEKTEFPLGLYIYIYIYISLMLLKGFKIFQINNMRK